jgi:phosphodiesterase/alkaline phosphatase D-like protein
MLLKVNTTSVDVPSQLTVQVARDANFSQPQQTTVLAKDATVVLKDLKPGQSYFVRFTATNAQGQPSSSPVFTLDVPGNWGTTITGMVQALQILR